MSSIDIAYIESDANPKVKRWKRLALEPRAVKRERATLLEGLHLLSVVLEHPKAEIAALILSEEAVSEAHELVEKLAERTGARVYGLTKRLYDQISPVENGAGCMCEMAIPAAAAPEDWREADVLYLDGVQDAGNVGTLIRTAVASGIRHIAASPDEKPSSLSAVTLLKSKTITPHPLSIISSAGRYLSGTSPRKLPKTNTGTFSLILGTISTAPKENIPVSVSKEITRSDTFAFPAKSEYF